ncbi:MAG: DUF3800 domain-containing protein [Methylococcales bacterium]|nr:MAG: DUF3800 domain-containing protein [Methylococcales bacterium]
MANRVYIFLDEGGNFDFSSNGTPYFVLTSVMMQRPFLIHPQLEEYKHDCLEFGLNTEYFHCTEDNTHVRKKVFSIIEDSLDCLKIDSLIIEKRKIIPALHDEKKFYPIMLGYLLRHVFERESDNNIAAEIIVITDTIPIKHKRQSVEKAIKHILKEILPKNCRYKVLHHSSKSHFGLQVADYCNWAVFRKWQTGDTEYYDRIKRSLESEIDIFGSETDCYY